MKMMTFFFISLFVTIGNASNPGISYQGRIFKPDESPLEGTSVYFRMQVRSPGSENCLLYEEVQILNMAGSSGVFSITLNDGTGTRLDTPTYQVDRIFSNRDTMTLDSTRCAIGTTYTPNSADGRKLIVYFKDESMAAYEAMPILNLNYAPQAMYALESQRVGEFAVNNLLRAVDAGGNPVSVPAFDPTQITKLDNLLAGTSNQYATSTEFSSVQTFAKTSLPTCAGGEVLKANGTALSCVADSSGAAGTVTNVTSANSYLSVASGGTTPVLTLNVGTIANTVAAGNDSRISGALQSGATAGGSLAGTYPNPTVAAGAITNTEISNAAAISDSKLATISTAGKVSGSAITSGTIGGSAAINTSGSIQTSGMVALFDAGPTNSVSLRAPTAVASNYTLTFPDNKPSVAGYLLAGDTSGNLSWVVPNSGSVTNVTATAPVASSGGATPVISMAQANTSTSGYLSNTDWNTFNNKQSSTLAAGNIWVGNGSNVATGVAPSGDVSMINTGAFTVNRIQGSAVSSTTPTSSGQVLRFDGTQWVPNFISMFDLRSTVTGTTTFSAGCTAGQTLAWTSATDNLACVNIAITGAQVSGDIAGNAANVVGVVAIANGGTGASTQSGAASAILPVQTGNSGKVLTTDGTNVSWGTASSQWTTSGGNIYYNSGNVGLGTASPNTLLTLKPTLETTVITVKNPSNVDTATIGVGTGGYGKFILSNSSGGQAIAIVGSPGAGSYLGVTTSASSLVDGATSSFGAGLNISVPNVLNNENGISFGTADISTKPGAAITFYDSDTSTYGNSGLRFKTSSGTLTTRMTIDPTGNVGIGTTSPQTTLQVAGVISPATNNTFTLGNATYRFTEVYATNGVINTSDRREKKDIYNTDLGLEFINKLRPVSYRWNTGVDDDVHYGLIAQEAEKALAEIGKTEKTSLITHDETIDRYGVRYSELISPLIKAVQELYTRILGINREIASVRTEKADKTEVDAKFQKLESENERLRQESTAKAKEMAELKARLDRIERALKAK